MKDAVIMGFWQVLALVPGTSRSGITITAARQLGYARQDAARLAMLMSIPTILASGTLLGAELLSIWMERLQKMPRLAPFSPSSRLWGRFIL